MLASDTTYVVVRHIGNGYAITGWGLWFGFTVLSFVAAGLGKKATK